MKKTIAMMMVLVASATFAGCTDMKTKNATAGGMVMNGEPAGTSQACKADAGPDDALVGKTEADAAAQLDGCLWRVLERDGKALPGTMDYRQERRNLGIRDGKVIWVRRG
ncbi:hypothetical protein [Burkholderia aenigmatica]|uniref:Lipoprotein n=1 Tax=Burkholderia aenigmatica TaxID=2015348 RepID=A0A228J1R4_9BURK|nr:hypothetical protein [Burkholderia aenigmatica]OXI48706.1 hypothetical protein CFB84_07280 [Burkholderia aenigmatica]